MPKATPSKAELPKKPEKPRQTQDAALYAQRTKEYERLLEIYEAEMAEYEKGQKEREKAKAAVRREAAKAAKEADAAAKAASKAASKAATPVKSPISKSAISKRAAGPSARQLAASISTVNTFEQDPRFMAANAARQVKQNAWVNEVALYAEQGQFLGSNPNLSVLLPLPHTCATPLPLRVAQLATAPPRSSTCTGIGAVMTTTTTTRSTSRVIAWRNSNVSKGMGRSLRRRSWTNSPGPTANGGRIETASCSFTSTSSAYLQTGATTGSAVLPHVLSGCGRMAVKEVVTSAAVTIAWHGRTL